MDEYLHVSIENMHAGQSGNPDRREKERRQQHYSDQARIAELEAALRTCTTPIGVLDVMDAPDMYAHISSINFLAESILAKG